MRRRRLAAWLVAISAALLIVVPSGLSAGPSAEQVALGHTRVAAVQHRNGVPFTAFDLALIVGGGGGLIAAGAGLRRAALKRT